MGKIAIRPALLVECESLSALCLCSKGWWGYDDAFLDACRDDLSITQRHIDGLLRVAELDGNVAGLVHVAHHGSAWSLDALFVDPPFIGKAVGTALMLWAIEAAGKEGASHLVIDADPGAANFYRRFGAVDEGVAESTVIPGRLLPRLVLGLL